MSFFEARPQRMRWQKRTAPTTKPSAMRKLEELEKTTNEAIMKIKKIYHSKR